MNINNYQIPYNPIILTEEESFQQKTNTLSCIDLTNMNRDNFFKSKRGNSKVIYYDNTILSYMNEISYEGINEIINSKSIKLPIDQAYINHSRPYPSHAVQFDGDFESGNLLLAVEQSLTEYDLYLRHELNTSNPCQWFFFKVIINKNKPYHNETNKTEDLRSDNDIFPNGSMIKINIMNLSKGKVPFNSSIPILCYYNHQWTRDTYNIHYCFNNYKNNLNNNNFSTLTFCFDYTQSNAKDDSNEYFFSYCYPYTYSKLNQYLYDISLQVTDPNRNIIRFGSIGKTLMGNKLHLLVISDFNDSKKSIGERPAIILTSRIHPAESNSSYVIQGVIDFLLEDNPITNELRKRFIWKIVPMLNPDGVINGNFRYNLCGRDLNRAWVDGDINTAPTVFYMKEMIQRTLNSRNVNLYCDFHGHSGKPNFFLYTCNKKDKDFIDCYYANNDQLDLTNCVYKVIPAKSKTGRAVVNKEFGVDASYCLESSVASMTMKNENGLRPMTIVDYKQIGKDFCRTVYQMNQYDKNPLSNDEIAVVINNNNDNHFNINKTMDNINRTNTNNQPNKKKKSNAKRIIFPMISNRPNGDKNLTRNNAFFASMSDADGIIIKAKEKEKKNSSMILINNENN